MQDARRAVVALLAIVAAIAATFVGVIDSRSKTSAWHDGWFVLWAVILAVAVGLAILAAIPDFATWLSGSVRVMRDALRRPKSLPGRLVTDRWHYSSHSGTTIGSYSDLAYPEPGTGSSRVTASLGPGV